MEVLVVKVLIVKVLIVKVLVVKVKALKFQPVLRRLYNKSPAQAGFFIAQLLAYCKIHHAIIIAKC